MDFSGTETLQYFSIIDYFVLSWGKLKTCFCLLWGVPLGLSSILLCRVLFTAQQFSSDTRVRKWETTSPRPMTMAHQPLGTLLSSCCRIPPSAALFQDFVMGLHLTLIMSEDLFVPSLLPLSSIVLFHRYFIDFSGATHSVRYSFCRGSMTEPGPVGPAEWSIARRRVAESWSTAMQHSLGFKQCIFLCFSKDLADI